MCGPIDRCCCCYPAHIGVRSKHKISREFTNFYHTHHNLSISFSKETYIYFIFHQVYRCISDYSRAWWGDLQHNHPFREQPVLHPHHRARYAQLQGLHGRHHMRLHCHHRRQLDPHLRINEKQQVLYIDQMIKSNVLPDGFLFLGCSST